MNKNFVARLITGLVAAAIVIPSIIFSPYGIWLVCALVSVLGLREFLHVSSIKKLSYTFLPLSLGISIWIIFLLQLLNGDFVPSDMTPIFLVGIAVLPLMELVLLFTASEKQPLQTLGAIVLGFVYCFLPLVLLYKMAVPDMVVNYDYQLPLGVLLLTWVLDSFSYFAGRLFGKHPLFPRISPKKTWEGAAGGTLFCIIGGLLLNYFFTDHSVPYNWLVVAAIICVFSQLGDLVESMFKRSVQLKDSGSILPGHGGILDRFDGLYLSLPFLYLYFSML